MLFLDKEKHNEIEYLATKPKEILFTKKERRYPLSNFGSESWQFFNQEELTIKNKLFANSIELLSLPSFISRGSSTGDDNIFCLKSEGSKFFTRNNEPVEIEYEILRTPLYATDFSRYSFSPQRQERIIFPYEIKDNNYKVIEERQLQTEYPKAYNYLKKNKANLEKRKQYKLWYGYSAPRNLNLHDQSKILIPLLADKGLFTLAPENVRSFCIMASAGFSVSFDCSEYLKKEYVLGLLNSKLLFWYLKNLSNKFRGGWITCTKQYFGLLPIKKINKSNNKERTQHDKLVSLVEAMLDLNKRLQGAKTPDEKRVLERQIEGTDRAIDELVYELYGLTEEEIRIVEETTKEKEKGKDGI